jgi:superfamily I DNA and RNA helicase
MSLDILVTTDRINNDPDGRGFIQYVQQHIKDLDMEKSALYYDFPTYADYETISHKPDILIASKDHGVIAIRFISDETLFNGRSPDIADIDDSLGQFCSILIGRFLKSKILRSGRSKLLLDVTPLIFNFSAKNTTVECESDVITSYDGLAGEFSKLKLPNSLSDDAYAEMRSVLEGAKALTRPAKRLIADAETQKPALALAKLEAEIANFDQKQRRAALITITGPQRIRGLAGSGKTIILAMKVAHLHLTRPDENILITFLTKSLKVTIKSLITKFFRHYKDEDPNWNRIHIRHGWGGARTHGTYADACRENGVTPLNLNEARRVAPSGVDPFDHACRLLLSSVNVKPYYDHVMIDEGQDFPAGFYELIFQLAKGHRDKKSIIWAYDELQNILNVRMRSPEELFGFDEDGSPRISLSRSGHDLPPGATNDTVLNKCYRNQREVLVVAHALGFGIYSDIVQILEDRDHWWDVGYEVISGDLTVGSETDILRPEENNPLSISGADGLPLIAANVARDFSEEIATVASGILEFLKNGLNPEDIVVIALDDKNARQYFIDLSATLAENLVSTNNIIADPYSEPPFSIDGMVTLSTVYRAKGNEAAAVFVIGVDAVSLKIRSGRNKLFTALTRSKAWVRISGVGQVANSIAVEIQTALNNFPSLKFVMPDLAKVEMIQRDLSMRTITANKIRSEYLARLRNEGFNDEEIADILVVEHKHG